MNDITFNILKIVVTVATALISVYVIPLLKEKSPHALWGLQNLIIAGDNLFKDPSIGFQVADTNNGHTAILFCVIQIIGVLRRDLLAGHF